MRPKESTIYREEPQKKAATQGRVGLCVGLSLRVCR